MTHQVRFAQLHRVGCPSRSAVYRDISLGQTGLEDLYPVFDLGQVRLIHGWRGGLMIRRKMMVSLIGSAAFALLLSGASGAGDSEWRVYSEEANGNVHFFDTSRVKMTGNVHTVWNRILYKTSVMGASSYQSLLEINCSERTERILQRTFFSDRQWQKPAMSTDSNKKPERSIAKGSASERLFEVVCDQ